MKIGCGELGPGTSLMPVRAKVREGGRERGKQRVCEGSEVSLQVISNCYKGRIGNVKSHNKLCFHPEPPGGQLCYLHQLHGHTSTHLHQLQLLLLHFHLICQPYNQTFFLLLLLLLLLNLIILDGRFNRFSFASLNPCSGTPPKMSFLFLKKDNSFETPAMGTSNPFQLIIQPYIYNH